MRVLREPGDQSNKKQCAKTLGGARGVQKLFVGDTSILNELSSHHSGIFKDFGWSGSSLLGVKTNQKCPKIATHIAVFSKILAGAGRLFWG